MIGSGRRTRTFALAALLALAGFCGVGLAHAGFHALADNSASVPAPLPCALCAPVSPGTDTAGQYPGTLLDREEQEEEYLLSAYPCPRPALLKVHRFLESPSRLMAAGSKVLRFG
jgi:hypothetical protein